MLEYVGTFADAVWAGRWLMAGTAGFIVLAVIGFTLIESFVDGCREKPERANLLAALIASWLTS